MANSSIYFGVDWFIGLIPCHRRTGKPNVLRNKKDRINGGNTTTRGAISMIELTELTLQTKSIFASILFVFVGGLITFFLIRRRKKKKKIEGMEEQRKNEGILGQVPVKIIQKRGDTIRIINTKGTIKKADKQGQGELKLLYISKNQQLDNFDFTKINRDGHVVVVEKFDGQLTYADIDKDKVSTTGEGMLRDGYYLNQRFVDEAFPINKDSWAKWVPLIVVFFAIIGIGISSYLTYNYYKELNKGYTEMSQSNVQAITQATQSMERIARSLEIATENQKGIEQAYRELITEINGGGG